uniref:Ribosomal protein S19 n=1 Tax=Paramoeba aparasomata TaxID=2583407 RepID=A0A5P8HBJ4_9EUKA|nr:hypothetical protein [Paramoeba aparasomata]
MLNQNFFIFFEKYLNKSKKTFIKQNLYIKILNRALNSTVSLLGLNLAVHNGIAFIPVYMDINKMGHMLAVFAFSFSIKLKKKIKIFKKKKKK